jgi:hypothetical protein
MTTTIITTFSNKNYSDYANYFMASLEKYLDKNVNVLVYTDSPLFDNQENWTNVILADECPNLVEFKKRNGHKPVPTGAKGFMFDAVRFSHKSFCIVDASRKIQSDRMIWLDADTEILSPISEDYLRSHLDDGKFVSYLGRDDRYTETGWLSFDLSQSSSTEFFDLWEWYYNTDEIYKLSGQLDCHVFDATREKLEAENKIQGQSISPPNVGKAHFDLRFKNYMCHYKGERKEKRDVYFAKAMSKKKKK